VNPKSPAKPRVRRWRRLALSNTHIAVAMSDSVGQEEEGDGPLCQPIDENDLLEEPDPPLEQPRVLISDAIRSAFTFHTQHLREARRKRRASLKVGTVVGERAPEPEAAGSSSNAVVVAGAPSSQEYADFGEALPGDLYEGDCVLRTLHKLLAMVDDRGYARSPQQCQFHDAFIRACSRVMYRSDWSMNKPAIMKHNAWADCPSQILVSTPRRFGKTFR
jgi:hypothetical protein